MKEEYRGMNISKTVSTLDDAVEIRNQRNCGNTTRQVNYAVDKLFDGYSVLIKDHAYNGTDIRLNEALLNSIIDRLNFESKNGLQEIKVQIFGKYKIIKFK